MTLEQYVDNITKQVKNISPAIIKQIADKFGLTFVAENENGNLCFANNNDELRDDYKQVFLSLDLLNYIYAVLHSSTYRERYKEFLNIDFTSIPYPKDVSNFWKLVQLGNELRQLHLLASPIVTRYITLFPKDGDNVVTQPKYQNGKVYINDTQYFDNVPQMTWTCDIGGFQPAQKWLTDHIGHQLEFNEIQHYQKIIAALAATHTWMKEIDKI